MDGYMRRVFFHTNHIILLYRISVSNRKMLNEGR
jgi:hypothetical protein